jgi:hypothetical protein
MVMKLRCCSFVSLCTGCYLALATAGFSPALYAQIDQFQTNQLQYGWNLIAFQMAPTNPSPAAVFNTNTFRGVWTYDNATSNWFQYGRPAPGQPQQNGILPMADIEIGRAYWA